LQTIDKPRLGGCWSPPCCIRKRKTTLEDIGINGGITDHRVKTHVARRCLERICVSQCTCRNRPRCESKRHTFAISMTRHRVTSATVEGSNKQRGACWRVRSESDQRHCRKRRTRGSDEQPHSH